jgi:transcription factor E2F7/8
MRNILNLPFSRKNKGSLLVWRLDEDEDEKKSKYKRDKSLGILCQQFIGLFVTWRQVISLEDAARQISIKEDEEAAAAMDDA